MWVTCAHEGHSPWHTVLLFRSLVVCDTFPYKGVTCNLDVLTCVARVNPDSVVTHRFLCEEHPQMTSQKGNPNDDVTEKKTIKSHFLPNIFGLFQRFAFLQKEVELFFFFSTDITQLGNKTVKCFCQSWNSLRNQNCFNLISLSRLISSFEVVFLQQYFNFETVNLKVRRDGKKGIILHKKKETRPITILYSHFFWQ